MIYILLNIAPIALATLAGLIIGAVWLRFSKILLPGLHAIALTALAEFWLASILAGALILAPPEDGAWTMALGSAFVIWIGFVLPVLAVTFAVFEKPLSRFAWCSGALACCNARPGERDAKLGPHRAARFVIEAGFTPRHHASRRAIEPASR